MRATGDFVADVEARDCRRCLELAVAELPAVERRVIRLRFGFDGPPHTLREVALLLHVTSERVRQIQVRALRRLRRKARRTGIADYHVSRRVGWPT